MSIYSYNGHTFSNQNKSTIDSYNKVDEYPKHFAGEMKWNKSDTKDYMLFDDIHMTF